MTTKKRVDTEGLFFFIGISLIMLGLAGLFISSLNAFYILIGVGVITIWSLILYIYLESGFYREEKYDDEDSELDFL